MQEVVEDVKRESIRSLIADGKRADGRAFDQLRELTYETNVISTTEGSCLLHMGDTQILVAVKTAAGEPYPDSPNEGVLITSAELVPLASPDVESGPPLSSDKYIEIARVVDRSIRESKMIDFSKLCLEKGKYVIVVFVDIHTLDDGGNLIDGATLASVIALTACRMKKWELKDGKPVAAEQTQPLPITRVPIACSVAKFGEALLVDTTHEEEIGMDSKIVFGLDEGEHIRAMQKTGSGPWSREQIKAALELARRTVSDLRKKLKLEAVA